MYKVKLTAKAKKELKKISRRHQFALGQIFDELKVYPNLGKPLDRELTGKFSYRISFYRIVYKVDEKDKIVYVSTAGYRSTVYKRIRR